MEEILLLILLEYLLFKIYFINYPPDKLSFHKNLNFTHKFLPHLHPLNLTLPLDRHPKLSQQTRVF